MNLVKKLLLILSLIYGLSGYSQIHNRVIKINTGFSTEQFDHKNTFEAFNDTSSHTFELVSWSPTLSYSHEFVVNQVLSFSGTLGFQYMNIYYDHQYFGSPYLYASLNPQVSLFYKRGFEYYIKLQAGVTVWFHHPEIINDQMRRLFPDRVNMFTGVTLGGFNYYLSDHMGLNLELSIWSPELATFGVTYRFFKGELPTIQDSQEKGDL